MTKTEKHCLYVGRCERYRQAIYNRSNVLKNNTPRRPSIFISHLDNDAKPALRRDTNSAKHDTVRILDQRDHPIAKNFSTFYKFCRPYAVVGTVSLSHIYRFIVFSVPILFNILAIRLLVCRHSLSFRWRQCQSCH